jgi:hypothetical protein
MSGRKCVSHFMLDRIDDIRIGMDINVMRVQDDAFILVGAQAEISASSRLIQPDAPFLQSVLIQLVSQNT